MAAGTSTLELSLRRTATPSLSFATVRAADHWMSAPVLVKNPSWHDAATKVIHLSAVLALFARCLRGKGPGVVTAV